jgi:hypothetical protein
MSRLIPWFTKILARRYQVLDPAGVLARIRMFAQPSEVAEPLELLRAGIVFHARGLVNAKAIQHNLDWIWPYWVERQFNPQDISFVPRAFSFSHINLTHRNWTAVGLPDCDAYPIVDPHGLITPLHDGWSLDFWIVTDTKRKLIPSKLPDTLVKQSLSFDPVLRIETRSQREDLTLVSRVRVERDEGIRMIGELEASTEETAWLVVAVRPYNPEGIQFIQRLEYVEAERALWVNDSTPVLFRDSPDALRMAHYAEGDVYHGLDETRRETETRCDVGMATAAVLFRLQPGEPRRISFTVPIASSVPGSPTTSAAEAWTAATENCARLKIGDTRMQFLYDAAVRTVLLLSANAFVPGPYTYRRFWFRDACLMLHSLLVLGCADRAQRILETFPSKQKLSGYFESQEGEWDSNGQVLWIASRFTAMTGRPWSDKLESALRKAIVWLRKKRLSENAKPGTAGLLPAGFSAEHLGPNDFYYWDDFWAAGGLLSAAKIWKRRGADTTATEASQLGNAFLGSIAESLSLIPSKRGRAIPAAPSRRMDAGAVGSMVADYPLQLYPPRDERIEATLRYLRDHCFQRGGFFQEMIHSGINAYLTLDLAQTLLRNGDPAFAELIRSVANLASPTGQWPEAIHPLTLGGCMGDGQHGWAAAEWIMMIRNCFVREEEEAGELIIGSGILPEWRENGDELHFGPTLTAWGEVTVDLNASGLQVNASWRGHPPRVRIAMPGFLPVTDVLAGMRYRLQPDGS